MTYVCRRQFCLCRDTTGHSDSDYGKGSSFSSCSSLRVRYRASTAARQRRDSLFVWDESCGSPLRKRQCYQGSLQNTPHASEDRLDTGPSADAREPYAEVLMPGLGTLKISALQQEELNAAAVVLTRSFAASPQGIPIDECR